MKIVTFSQCFKVAVVLVLSAMLFGYPHAESVFMGLMLSMVMVGVLRRIGRISIFGLLAGGIPTFIAALLLRYIPIASGLIGIVLGIIVSSYIFALRPSNSRQTLGPTLGILLGVLGSYFVSPAWGDLFAGLLMGALVTVLCLSPNHAQSPNHSLVK